MLLLRCEHGTDGLLPRVKLVAAVVVVGRGRGHFLGGHFSRNSGNGSEPIAANLFLLSTDEFWRDGIQKVLQNCLKIVAIMIQFPKAISE